MFQKKWRYFDSKKILELDFKFSYLLISIFILVLLGVPSRIKEGMLVLSGDVLLLFNPLQIDAMFHGAAAISIKERVEIGKNHGVFLNDGHDNVGNCQNSWIREVLILVLIRFLWLVRI